MPFYFFLILELQVQKLQDVYKRQTVISQFVSALWTFQFLTGQKTILKLKKERLKLKIKHVKKIFALGMAGFMMGLTNSVVTIVCNATLQTYGGDVYKRQVHYIMLKKLEKINILSIMITFNI